MHDCQRDEVIDYITDDNILHNIYVPNVRHNVVSMGGLCCMLFYGRPISMLKISDKLLI